MIRMIKLKIVIILHQNQMKWLNKMNNKRYLKKANQIMIKMSKIPKKINKNVKLL